MTFSFFMPLMTHPDAASEDTLRRALDLAATLGGTVTAQVNEVDIEDVANVLSDALIDVSGMIAEAEARSKANCEALLGTVDRVADMLRLPLVQRRLRGHPAQLADASAAVARTFDYSLVVDQEVSYPGLAEAMLFGSGGPAILFPSADVASHLELVAVAWDGGRAAGRALRDAVPILARAKKTVIITASDDKAINQGSIDAVRGYLDLKGIQTNHLDVKRGTLDVGNGLQKAALEAGAGLLVMGAYGHSRMREFVLGGATRAVVARRDLPVLMSH